mmetsp:Transcript_10233/g.15713  ORF Transcript_10233/g.15713 Transcript_10233/m.15713 type:complete len:256 (+) Transcript_10233:134-901(+)
MTTYNYPFSLEKQQLHNIAASASVPQIMINDQNPSYFSTLQALRSSALSVLELPMSASNQDIKAQYRRLALRYHPDKVYNDTEEAQKIAHDQFSKISAAYELLTTEDQSNLQIENSIFYASRFTDPHELFRRHNSIRKMGDDIDPIPNPFQQPAVAGYLTEFAAPTRLQQRQQNKRHYYDHFVAPDSPTTTVMYDENNAFLQNRSAKRVKVLHENSPPLPHIAEGKFANRDASWNTANGHSSEEPLQKRPRMSYF